MLYFFDIDDTIADTDNYIIPKLPHDFSEYNRNQQIEILETILVKDDYLNIPIINNAVIKLLKSLIHSKNDNIYYLTARKEAIRQETILWLKKHGLWVDEDRLVMNSDNKCQDICKVLSLHSPKCTTAILFDDSKSTILDTNNYINIIGFHPQI